MIRPPARWRSSEGATPMESFSGIPGPEMEPRGPSNSRRCLRRHAVPARGWRITQLQRQSCCLVAKAMQMTITEGMCSEIPGNGMEGRRPGPSGFRRRARRRGTHRWHMMRSPDVEAAKGHPADRTVDCPDGFRSVERRIGALRWRAHWRYCYE